MIRKYLRSRSRVLAIISAFIAGVAITIWSWVLGAALLVLALVLDIFSFQLGSR